MLKVQSDSMNKNFIKTLIVDDEPLAREYIRHLLANDEEIEIVGEASNGRKALDEITEFKPDLIFLDVQMPEMDGFSMLENLDEREIPAIIFTTAYEEYAIRAFEFHALDYLLKPFDQTRFDQALNYAKELLNNREQKDQSSKQIIEMLKSSTRESKYLERLLIKQKGRIAFLKTRDIDCIKSDDKYVHLYSGKSSYLVRQTLSAMLEQLDPNVFVQIHRSAIVNIEKITELQQLFKGDYSVMLENGMELISSRNYKNNLFNLIGKPL